MFGESEKRLDGAFWSPGNILYFYMVSRHVGVYKVKIHQLYKICARYCMGFMY